jgi:3-methyladenine DNA glycosylase/8-oxoguanine DNA glycosylase
MTPLTKQQLDDLERSLRHHLKHHAGDHAHAEQMLVAVLMARVAEPAEQVMKLLFDLDEQLTPLFEALAGVRMGMPDE